ncbi:MAG: YhjD/YihY/BrkB family envelope integrity protein [Myxococcota bacterium]|jgi:membrane protein|nr:YhjD/YihY/BrkB family envelope integrity protein [Myxococcota bacterium]
MKLSPMQQLERVQQFLFEDLWRIDQHPRSLLGMTTRALQVVMMVGEGFVKDQLLLRASALTYVTALSVIPLFAVAFSIVRLFDPNNDLAVVAVEYLAAGSPGASETLLELVESANIVGLGSVGAATLFLSTVLALRHLETTLNSIWGVRKNRGFARRFSDYLAVIIVVPLFTGAAMSLGATLQSDPIVTRLLEWPGFALLYEMGLRYAPGLFLLAGFSFIYWFFPNTKVQARSALLGGLLAAVLFSIAQSAYLGMSFGAARASALYGGFAALPLLFVWLYVCWAIVLLGAEFSFAHQNRDHYRLEVSSTTLSPAEVETLGLMLSVEVARAFRDDRTVPSAEVLAAGVGASVRAVREVLDLLEDDGILSQCNLGDEGEGYRLGRPAERIRVADLLDAIRGQRGETIGEPAEAVAPAVEEMIGELDRATARYASSHTLGDILAKVPERPEPRAEDADADDGAQLS